MLTLYGIPSCDSCRDARKWLDAAGIAYRFHDLREDGVDIQTLERWSETLDWRTLLNKASLTWRKLPEVDRNDMTRERSFATMIEHPTLIKRPVLELDGRVAVGYSPAKYEEILQSS